MKFYGWTLNIIFFLLWKDMATVLFMLINNLFFSNHRCNCFTVVSTMVSLYQKHKYHHLNYKSLVPWHDCNYYCFMSIFFIWSRSNHCVCCYFKFFLLSSDFNLFCWRFRRGPNLLLYSLKLQQEGKYLGPRGMRMRNKKGPIMKRFKWAGYIARREEGRSAFKILTGSPTGQDL